MKIKIALILSIYCLILVSCNNLINVMSVITPTTEDSQLAAPKETLRPEPLATTIPTELPTNTSIPPTPTESYKLGDTRVSHKDGMVMVYVPGGTFTMGSTAEEVFSECQKFRDDCSKDWFTDDTDEEPPHLVTLDAYWIDQTEVTNAMYAQCVVAGDCSNPSKNESDTRDSYYGNPQYDNFPVIHVNWEQANAYCQWAGRELPTEAQWEYAARGPNGYTYPWGNDAPTCERANYFRLDGGHCEEDTTAVDSHEAGKSWVGAYDLAGNVWEWVRDVYASYTSEVFTNPLFLTVGDNMVLRGGSRSDNELDIRSANRTRYFPVAPYYNSGFRCFHSISP